MSDFLGESFGTGDEDRVLCDERLAPFFWLVRSEGTYYCMLCKRDLEGGDALAHVRQCGKRQQQGSGERGQ